MKLSKQPETEHEYFLALESVNSFVSVLRSRDDIDEDIIKDIADASHIQIQLYADIHDKFGVLSSHRGCQPGLDMPHMPEGKIWYIEWCLNHLREELDNLKTRIKNV